MRSETVPPVASRQSGVFTASQALDAGWSQRQIRRRTTEKAWVRVAGAGLAASGTRRTPEAVGWAIHLTLASAVVSHVTAGRILGFPLPGPVPAHASLGAGRDRSRSIRTWRWPVPREETLMLERSVPLTDRTRTAVDCLAVLPRQTALSLLAWATTRTVVTSDDLAAALDRYRGRAGVDQLRYLNDLCRRGALSVAEARCHEVLDRFGITGWEANLPVHDDEGLVCVADIVFAEQRVIVEVDGWTAHGSREAFVRDRRVQARLVAAGWVVLRVTWDDLSGSGQRWADQLRRTLAGRSAA